MWTHPTYPICVQVYVLVLEFCNPPHLSSTQIPPPHVCVIMIHAQKTSGKGKKKNITSLQVCLAVSLGWRDEI